jgi:succinate dehydrogenase / fumarate reductase cytochrome b subunit
MSTIALSGGTARAAALYQSVVGKKVVMAGTGLVLCGFVLIHMLGNLQIYLGAEKLNAYGAFLQSAKGMVWLARIVLLACTGLHILAACQLTVLNKFQARSAGYVKKASVASTYAARTMVWSGPILAVFIVYHVLHFTTGGVHPDFRPGDVYHNMVAGFRIPAVSLFYIAANLMLALHLYHGVWSMFQTLGVSHPRYTPWLKRGAAAFGYIVGAGNVSIPLAVLTGLVK